ncbi:MAG: hypothetical protein ACM3YF_05680 [Candidatus Zixiibacteriota bacterium]
MLLKRMWFPKSKKLVFLPAGVFLLFSLFTSGCEKSVKVSFTTRDIIRFLIRDNPGIFSNSFLDTSRVNADGSDFFFSRAFTVKLLDTAITLNDMDTISTNPLNIVSKSPRDAGAEIIDTLIGQLKIDSARNPRPARNFRLPVTKFGYFQKLQSDAFVNRGWLVLGATQTFVGGVRILDSVQIVGMDSNRDTLVIRQARNPSLDPLSDPQVFKVRTNPFQLKPQDSVEIRAWLRPTSIDTLFYVFCHINDFSTKRRIQLAEVDTNEFFGGFKLAPDARLDYLHWRLAVDVIANGTLTNPVGTIYNEIWGIIYQVYP